VSNWTSLENETLRPKTGQSETLKGTKKTNFKWRILIASEPRACTQYQTSNINNRVQYLAFYERIALHTKTAKCYSIFNFVSSQLRKRGTKNWRISLKLRTRSKPLPLSVYSDHIVVVETTPATSACMDLCCYGLYEYNDCIVSGGEIIDRRWVRKSLEGRDSNVIEMLSRNLLGGVEENHRNRLLE
jgi:hypothetical protein